MAGAIWIIFMVRRRLGLARWDWIRWGIALLAAGTVGCLREPEPKTSFGTIPQRILRSEPEGPIALILLPHPLSPQGGIPALEQALVESMREGKGSGAVFFYAARSLWEPWLTHEIASRREKGIKPQLILAGHSWGGSAVCELTKRLLARESDVTILLLVTVDAIKSTRIGATAGMAASAIGKVNPIPGVDINAIAYTNAPPVDGTRLIRHTNYYQDQIRLCRGAPMEGASENHRITSHPPEAINHGNVDDYAYPFLVADFRAAFRTSPRKKGERE